MNNWFTETNVIQKAKQNFIKIMPNWNKAKEKPTKNQPSTEAYSVHTAVGSCKIEKYASLPIRLKKLHTDRLAAQMQLGTLLLSPAQRRTKLIVHGSQLVPK